MAFISPRRCSSPDGTAVLPEHPLEVLYRSPSADGTAILTEEELDWLQSGVVFPRAPPPQKGRSSVSWRQVKRRESRAARKQLGRSQRLGRITPSGPAPPSLTAALKVSGSGCGWPTTMNWMPRWPQRSWYCRLRLLRRTSSSGPTSNQIWLCSTTTAWMTSSRRRWSTPRRQPVSTWGQRSGWRPCSLEVRSSRPLSCVLMRASMTWVSLRPRRRSRGTSYRWYPHGTTDQSCLRLPWAPLPCSICVLPKDPVEEVNILWAPEGNSFMRTHGGVLYTYHGFSWRKFEGVFSSSALRRIKRKMMALEGLYRKIGTATARDRDSIIHRIVMPIARKPGFSTTDGCWVFAEPGGSLRSVVPHADNDIYLAVPHPASDPVLEAHKRRRSSTMRRPWSASSQPCV